SEYRVYLVMQGNAARVAAQALRDAIAAGDLAAAQTAWAAARQPWRHIQPLAYRLSDLENTIDPRATYLAGREADPAFTGYHRLEYGLFAQYTTEGLLPIADRLLADLDTLKTRLRAAPLDPQLLISLPVDTVERMAQSQITEGENAYAGNDLADLQASVEGVAKLVGLLRAVVAPVDATLDDQIGARLQQLEGDIAALKQGDTFPPYAAITAAQRKVLTGAMVALGEALGGLHTAIGMN
ncbi:MAG TPA: EfeM/EfeO family lipoprotein, partial [Paenirhodobacter sp.]